MAFPGKKLPPALKAINPYLKLAQEHDKRDPVTAYYARLYAMQKGMDIDKKSPECRAYLVELMDELEKIKMASLDNEAMQSEVVGQIHLENYAQKLFVYADTEDRAARFDKNVVKTFYSSALIMDILSTFGELNGEMEETKKYAKWKAAYINQCLKNGEIPVPGPSTEEKPIEGAVAPPNLPQPSNDCSSAPISYPNMNPEPTQPHTHNPNHVQNDVYAPVPTELPRQTPFATVPVVPFAPTATQLPMSSTAAAAVNLNYEHYEKATKYCRFAISAMQYSDQNSAIENLTKAISVLQTGDMMI